MRFYAYNRHHLEMKKQRVFLALGANLGNSLNTIYQALEAIQALPSLDSFKHSQLYQTSPVSSIPQNDFINAVCSFETDLSPQILLKFLQEIESSLGKVKKVKDAPRMIDIDILFFGDEFLQESNLIIPHPHWQERLFVLQPLSDLVDFLKIPHSKKETHLVSIDEIIQTFPNLNKETVFPI